jgi:Spy/CpxP family protein refolding chaperone
MSPSPIRTAAVVFSLAFSVAAPAMAQQSQIVMQALSDMRRLGLPTEGVTLTNSQAAAITSIANENRESRNDKRAAVKVVLRRGS